MIDFRLGDHVSSVGGRTKIMNIHEWPKIGHLLQVYNAE